MRREGLYSSHLTTWNREYEQGLLEDDDVRVRLAKVGYGRIQDFTRERNTDLLEHFMKQGAE